jgi:Caspase recruitment domain
VKLIEPDFDLIHELFLRKVLTESEKDKVCERNTARGQNELLLVFLKSKSRVQYQRFLYALDSTDQSHVANFIENPRCELNCLFVFF